MTSPLGIPGISTEAESIMYFSGADCALEFVLKNINKIKKNLFMMAVDKYL